MSAFTRTTRRVAKTAAISAFGVAVALGSTACSAGKISQTNNQEAAINGANGTLSLNPEQQVGDQLILAGNLAVRNLQIIYPSDQAAQVFGNGGPFKVGFTIANDSVIRKAKLTGITVPKGQVKFLTKSADGSTVRSDSPGDAGWMAPNQGLTTADPGGMDAAQAKAADVSLVEVELNGTGETVAAGLTVPMTLNFDVYDLEVDANGNPVHAPEKKSITIATPVDGSAAPTRDDN